MDINGQTHEGNTPLHCLMQSKVDNSVKIRLVERLLAHGDLDVDAKNNEDCRPIFFACKMCNVVLVRFLVEKCKADLTQKTCDGLNVLHAIVENKHGDRKKSEQQDECVEYLINECKAEWLTHERDERGLLPYQLAIISRLESTVLQLLLLATNEEILDPAGSYTSMYSINSIMEYKCGRPVHNETRIWNIKNSNMEYFLSKFS